MRIKGIAKVITVLALAGSVSIPVFAGAVGGARSGRFSVEASATDSFDEQVKIGSGNQVD